jgi:hypothetical protein
MKQELALGNLRDGRAASSGLGSLGEIEEVKRIGDMATAAKRFAQAQGMSEEARRYAAEIEVDAKRYLGELLAKQEKNRGGGSKPRSPVHNGNRSARSKVVQPPTLGELGLTKKQSAQAQKLAGIPQREYDKFKASATADTLNTRKALAVARAHERKKKLKVTGTAAASSGVLRPKVREVFLAVGTLACLSRFDLGVDGSSVQGRARPVDGDGLRPNSVNASWP